MFYLIFTIPILLWLFILSGASGIYTKKSIAGGGGSPEPPPPPPQPPSPAETTREAIQAQIEAVPEILATQQEYGPQFTQQQLDQLNQFGPLFAQAGLDLSRQFGGQFAEQTLKEQDILDPSRSAGSRAIADYLNNGPDQLTSQERRSIRENARGAASARGLAESGFSAVDEVAQLFGAQQQLKTRYLNTALAASGRLPTAQLGQTVSPNPLSVSSQLIQNVNPASIFGAQQAQNAYNSSIYNSQLGWAGSQAQGSGALWGSGISAAGGLAGSAMIAAALL